MRLVKCKKCGSTVMTDSTLLENMYEAMKECNEKARKAKHELRQSYIQEASQIKKMIGQIQHRTAQMEERNNTITCEYAEVIHYLRFNSLITDEKLDELRAAARGKAEFKNTEDEKEIQKVYGNFESMLTNRTKKDPTAKEALRRGN